MDTHAEPSRAVPSGPGAAGDRVIQHSQLRGMIFHLIPRPSRGCFFSRGKEVTAQPLLFFHSLGAHALGGHPAPLPANTQSFPRLPPTPRPTGLQEPPSYRSSWQGLGQRPDTPGLLPAPPDPLRGSAPAGGSGLDPPMAHKPSPRRTHMASVGLVENK